MTDGEALLRAICENPADDLPRLVYADWLEEHGEIERAEFIRVQIKLARCPFKRGENDPCICLQCSYDRRRERELLGRNYGNWTPLSWHQGSLVGIRLSGNASVEFTGSFLRRADFRRGFVASVSCRLEDWVGRGCEACRMEPADSRGISWGVEGPFGERPCSTCHGTGRIGAHGPAIVACQPVEELRFSRIEGYADGRFITAPFLIMPQDDNQTPAINWARREAGLVPLTPAPDSSPSSHTPRTGLASPVADPPPR